MIVSSVVVFAALRLAPGDPVTLFVGAYATPTQRALAVQELGLDQSVPVQYWRYAENVLQRDLGRSLFFRQPVSEVIKDGLWNSLVLGASGILLCYLVAVPLGIMAARHHNRPTDQLIRVGTIVGMAIPNFWLGLVLILVFGVYLGILPVSGAGSPAHVVLPAVTVAAEGIAVTARLVRGSMLEAMRQDFVRTLRALGIRERKVVYVHALRNALLPSINLLGLRIGWLLAGQVVVEYVFGWPGLGRTMINAILARDYPVVQALALLFTLVVILGNLLADMLTAAADPRTRRR